MSDKTKELLKLIKENPELPIVPFVDGSIGEDEGQYWLGSFEDAHINEYLLPSINSMPVFFKSDNEIFDTLGAFLTDYEFESLPDTEDECRDTYNALPWKKAIILYINPPEVNTHA